MSGVLGRIERTVALGGVPRYIGAARMAHGALLVALPGAVVRVVQGKPSGPVMRAVARVLGGRQLTQGFVTITRPSRSMLTLGAEIDLLHAVSMIAAAGIFPTHRRAALIDAAVATGLAATQVCAVRSTLPQAGD